MGKIETTTRKMSA